jgi:hypothetical protein
LSRFPQNRANDWDKAEKEGEEENIPLEKIRGDDQQARSANGYGNVN